MDSSNNNNAVGESNSSQAPKEPKPEETHHGGSPAEQAPPPPPPSTSTANNEVDAPEEEEEFQPDILSSAVLFNVETTPAFKVLDYMKTRREISPEKATELKNRLYSLHGILLTSFESEKTFLKRLKVIKGEITSQKLEMDKTQNRQFQENIEIGELKRELVKAENEFKLATSREESLQRDIEHQTKAAKDLSDEIDTLRRHQVDILEPQLIASIKELKLDVMQRKNQLENLQKDLEEKQSQYQVVLNEKGATEVEKEKHISLFSKASELPTKLQKQSEVFKEGITLLAVEATKQVNLLSQLDRDQEKLLKRKRELEDFSMNLRTDIERRKMDMNQVEKQSEQTFKEHQLAKEELFVQREEKVKIDLAYKKILSEVTNDGNDSQYSHILTFRSNILTILF